MNLSFAGCGFLGIYHVGVASCIKEYAPQLAKGCISGASAGALAAACLMNDLDLGDCTNFVLKIATQARTRSLGPLHPSFNISQIVCDGLRSILPDHAYKVCSGRLYVSLTRVSDRANVLVSEFDSNDDLIQALLCSAHVPFYSGIIPPSFRGVRYFDGGLSDNIPSIDDNTVTVSPFAGESDICPDDRSCNMLHIQLANTSIQFTARNLYRIARVLFPPHPEVLSEMCRQGFDDTLRFLQRNNLITCVKHLSIVSQIQAPPGQEDSMLQEEYDDDDVDDDLSDSGSDCDSGVGCSDCQECVRRQTRANLDSLPPPVIQALQAACARNTLLAHIYNTRLYKMMALAFTPMFLPLDIFYTYITRFVKYIPHMPGDGQWLASELPNFLRAVHAYFSQLQGSHSAKFHCHMNIRELEIEPRTPAQVRAGRRLSSIHSLNVDFALQFESHAHNPVECLHELEHQLVDHSHHHRHHHHDHHHDHHLDHHHDHLHDHHHDHHHHDHRHDHLHANFGSQPDLDLREGHNSCNSASYETFESYLEQVEHMETVMAFYYKDENDRLNVTEIRGLGSRPSTPAFNSRQNFDLESSELTWDNYQPYRTENVTLKDLEDIEADL